MTLSGRFDSRTGIGWTKLPVKPIWPVRDAQVDGLAEPSDAPVDEQNDGCLHALGGESLIAGLAHKLSQETKDLRRRTRLGKVTPNPATESRSGRGHGPSLLVCPDLGFQRACAAKTAWSHWILLLQPPSGQRATASATPAAAHRNRSAFENADGHPAISTGTHGIVP